MQAFLGAKMYCSPLHYRHHHKKHIEGSRHVHFPPRSSLFMGSSLVELLIGIPRGEYGVEG